MTLQQYISVVSFICLGTIATLTAAGNILVGLGYELFFLYYVLGFIPIAIHRLGHTRLWKLWFEQHVMHHHVKMYPSKHFDSVSPYRNELKWKYNGNVMNFAIPSFLACVAVSSSLPIFSYLVLCTALVLLREDYIHSQVHLRDSRWRNDRWYRALKAMHRVHHGGKMDKNFGFVDLFFDWTLGTLKFPAEPTF